MGCIFLNCLLICGTLSNLYESDNHRGKCGTIVARVDDLLGSVDWSQVPNQINRIQVIKREQSQSLFGARYPLAG